MIPTGTVILRPHADLAGGNAASGKAADFTTRVGERQPWRADTAFFASRAGCQPAGLIRPPLPRLAYCGLYASPLGWLAATAWQLMRPAAAGQAAVGGLMRGSAPAPRMQGENPLANPLARVPADPRLPKPIEHTRPRGIHAPGHSFGIIQTMLLALANFGLERMGRKNSSGYAGINLLGALRTQAKKEKRKKKKFFRPQAAKTLSNCCGFSRPNRASPQVKKSGSHARRDAGQGSWYRMYLTIRGR